MNTITVNHTRDKIELDFEKQTYQGLPEDVKKEIKSNFLFSGRDKIWVSRAKIAGAYRSQRLLQKLESEYGFCRQEEGQAPTFSEKVEQEIEKAQARAQKFSQRAEKNRDLSNLTWNRSSDMLKVIPMGQPILVGHHSERAHRSLLKKADKLARKSCELDDKAKYYERRADAAQNTANANKYNDAGYLYKRIKESQARLRTIENRLQGKIYQHSEPKEITEDQRKYWQDQHDKESDKLSFYQEKLEQVKALKTVYDRETISRCEYVKIRGRWNQVAKANPTTVAVFNTCFSTEELQKKYALKYNYGEIQDIR